MLKTLREKLAKIAQQMRDLHKQTETEDRGFTAEERQTWDSLNTDYEATEARISDAEKIAKMESTPAGIDVPVPNLASDSRNEPGSEDRSAVPVRETDEYRAAYVQYVRNGIGSVNAEQREQLIRGRVEMESRAQSAGTDSEGGYTVPEGFAGYITETMQSFSGLYGAANPTGSGGPTLLRTESGNRIPFPTNDDTANAGAILAENVVAPEVDLVFGERALISYMYTSKLVRVSLQLLQDQAVNLEAYLGNILGKRLGRGTAPHFAQGTGTAQPTGLVTAATDGAVNVSTGTGLTHANLLSFEHALDPAYRQAATWVFNDDTLKTIKSLVDGQARPLWLPNDAASIAQGAAGAFLLGYPYIIDQGLDNVGTGDRPVAFGDLSQFIIREALGMNLFRFNERYMDFLQIGFLAYGRWDSNLIDTSAVVTDIGVA
jgi:HK97 family phage major capsid protein